MDREDLIPTWTVDILRSLTDPGPVVVRAGTVENRNLIRSRGTTAGAANAYKLRVVCKSCNGGWMSRVENSAKSVLEPMVRDQRCALTTADQLTVAAWMTLKILTFDLLYEGDRAVDENDFDEFYRARQPPIRFKLALGRYERPRTHQTSHVRVVALAEASGGGVLADEPCDVQLTLVIGCLILQGVLVPLRARDYPVTFGHDVPDDFRVSIWPTTGVTSWPPSAAVSFEHLPRFAALGGDPEPFSSEQVLEPGREAEARLRARRGLDKMPDQAHIGE